MNPETLYNNTVAGILSNPAFFLEMVAALVVAFLVFWLIRTFVFPVLKAVLIVGVLIAGYLFYQQGWDATVQQFGTVVHQVQTNGIPEMPKADPFERFKHQ